MTDNLTRLFRPQCVAVIGGGWAQAVIDQCKRMGFEGDIWPVNPKRETMGGIRCYARVEDLPGAPDAVFLAVNRGQAVESVRALASMGAGGVVCFASGFRETGDAQGEALQQALVAAAGQMPVLGPNCYGFVNGLDRTPIWPDVHGMAPVERGVAIISQSSNIAINLTMQQRGLPIAYTLTVGNGAMVSMAQLVRFAAAQREVSAIGLYVEGFGDAAAFHAACAFAKAQGKPIIALKAGASEGAQAMALSHTASLAGGDDIARVFLEERCAVGRVTSLEGLLEGLKLLNYVGALPSPTLASLSCSGGEASLMADAGEHGGVEFPAFDEALVATVKAHCHPLVHVSNPFDYHTFDWGNLEALTGIYAGVMGGKHALNALVLDWPKAGSGDEAGWVTAAQAWKKAQAQTGARAVVLASMAENMPAHVLAMYQAMDIAPMQGLSAFMEALRASAVCAGNMGPAPLCAPLPAGSFVIWNEHEAKQRLAAFSDVLSVPDSVVVRSAEVAKAFFDRHKGQVVMKVLGDIAHKTELGGVVVCPNDPVATFDRLSKLTPQVLVETLAKPAIVEAIIGIHRDPVVGLCVTFGTGGVHAELWKDTVTLPLPLSGEAFEGAFEGLKLAQLARGYRGGQKADVKALIHAVATICNFAVENRDRLWELDINPLMVHAEGEGASIVDAFVRVVEAR